MEFDSYFAFVHKFFRGFKRVLKKDGRFAVNVLMDAKMQSRRVSPFVEYVNILTEEGLHFYSAVLLHEASPHRVKLTAWGSWLSPSSPYIYNPSEVVLLGYSEQWKKEEKGIADITKEEFLELVSGIWHYRAETKGKTVANFSEDIPYKAIKGLSFKGELVFDPFAGSGTTLYVAGKTGRRWIGNEISKKYCDVIKDRVYSPVLLPFV